MTTIAQKPGNENQKYVDVRFLYSKNSVILESRLDKLKMHIVNPRASTKQERQNNTADKSTVHIKWNPNITLR